MQHSLIQQEVRTQTPPITTTIGTENSGTLTMQDWYQPLYHPPTTWDMLKTLSAAFWQQLLATVFRRTGQPKNPLPTVPQEALEIPRPIQARPIRIQNEYDESVILWKPHVQGISSIKPPLPDAYEAYTLDKALKEAPETNLALATEASSGLKEVATHTPKTTNPLETLDDINAWIAQHID